MAEAKAENAQTERSTKRAQSTSRGARSGARSNGASASRSRSGGGSARRAAGEADKGKEAADRTAKDSSGTAKRVAGPAIAGAAAIAATAGAVAIARNGSRKGKGVSLPFIGGKRGRLAMPRVSLPHLHRPSDDDSKGALRATAKALGGTAVEIGKAGYRVGELTAEVRRVREQAAHKSN